MNSDSDYDEDFAYGREFAEEMIAENEYTREQLQSGLARHESMAHRQMGFTEGVWYGILDALEDEWERVTGSARRPK